MRIAIIGAGFAGLATAWYLLHHSQGSVSIDLYDPAPIGGGVSGISSGLLHLFSGKEAKKARDGEKKINCCHQLFSEASRAVSTPIVLATGILRPAITDFQIENFKKCSVENHETAWWDKEKCEGQVQGLKIPEKGGGLFIKQGLTIDVAAYLEGLWKALALFGTQFHQRAIKNEQELLQYERVIFTMGHAITQVSSLSQLPVEAIKGQVLQLKWPASLQTLPFSLISEGYLTMSKDHSSCFAGATFEKNFLTSEPDLAVAVPEIRKKIVPFFPAIADFEIISVKSGVRAANKKTHQPMMGRVSERHWFLTGLGSKGLLYHAYLGDLLSQALLQNDPTILPAQLRYGR